MSTRTIFDIHPSGTESGQGKATQPTQQTAGWPAAQLREYLASVSGESGERPTPQTVLREAAIAAEPTWCPPQPPLRRRIIAAAATPTKIAIGIVCAALFFSVLLVTLQPHTPTKDSTTAESTEHSNQLSELDSTTPDPQRAHSSTTTESAPNTIFVHVVGAVQNPGVFEMREGHRVADALAAAGGVTPEALTAAVNLARKIADGEQILVPDANSITPTAAGSPTSGAANAYSPSGQLNINIATIEQLDTLPRVGPTLAARIVEWRESNGPFHSIDQLTQITGIGEVLFAALHDLVVV